MKLITAVVFLGINTVIISATMVEHQTVDPTRRTETPEQDPSQPIGAPGEQRS